MKLNDSISHCIHAMMTIWRGFELNSIISSEYYSRLDKNSSSELEDFISKEEALSALKLRYPTPIWP